MCVDCRHLLICSSGKKKTGNKPTTALQILNVPPDVSSIKYLGRLVVDPLVGCKAPVFGETNIEPLTTQGVADVAAATSPPRGRPSRSHRR